MKQRIGTALLLILSCSFSLWAAETVYWRYTAWLEAQRPAFEPAGTKNDVYHHDLKPNFQGVQYFGDDKTMYRAQYFTNSLGFRDSAVVDIPTVPTRPRVVLIGDSFTEGVGIDFEHTMAGVIKTACPAVDLLNAGVASYAPALINLKLKERVIPLHPQQVIMLVDVSDVQDSLTYHAWLAEKDQPPRPADWHDHLRSFLHGRARVIEALLDVATPNVLANRDAPHKLNGDLWTTYYKDRVRWLVDRDVLTEWGNQGLDLLFEDLAETVRLSRAGGFALTLVIYPWPDQIKNSAFVVDYRGRMREFCLKNGVPLIDLFDDFPPTTLETHFLKGDVHWNQRGSKLVAQKLLPALGALAQTCTAIPNQRF